MTGEKVNPRWLAVCHLMFEGLSVAHMVVVSMYWGLLHYFIVKLGVFDNNPAQLTYMYTAHTMPVLSYLINYHLCEVRFRPDHGPYILLPFACIYTALNAYLTLYVYGKNHYYFLGEWTGVESPVICAVLTVMFCGVYY